MNKKLQDFKDEVSKMAHGMTRGEAVVRGICISCKEPATWYSEAGRREYHISGMCEPCWDKLFAETDSE